MLFSLICGFSCELIAEVSWKQSLIKEEASHLAQLPHLKFTVPNDKICASHEKGFEKIFKDQYIYALVEKKSSLVGSQKPHLTIQVCGLVEAPMRFTHQVLSQYDQYSEITDHIKSSEWHIKKKSLFLHAEALGYHSFMLVKTFPVQWHHGVAILDQQVTAGTMRDLMARIVLQDHGRRKTIVRLLIEYEYTQLPIPELFIESGFKLVFRQMAAALRGHVEKKYDRARHEKKVKL